MKTTTFFLRFTVIAILLFFLVDSSAQQWGSISFPGTANSGMNGDYTNITTGRITIEAWVYFDNNAGIIASNTSANMGFLMGFDGWFKFQIGNVISQWVDPTNWKSKWTHLACVLDGTNIIVYANGVEVGKTAYTGSYNDSPSIPLYVGRAPWGNPFTGKVADFRIWNVARSAAEIAANYKSKVAPASPGLFINYDFAEQTSDHTANLVSGSNTGWLMETATTNYTWGYMVRIPQNLIISNKTANGFDLTWESGLDNGWEVSITDAANTTTNYTNLTSRLKSFTGLTSSSYLVKVRTTSPAQTDWSTPLVVNQEWGSISFPSTANSGMNGNYTNITTGRITIETWVYFDNNAGIIASNTTANMGFLMGFDGWFKFQIGNAISQWVDPTNWKGKWTHLACVLDGTNIIVYANGVEVGKTAYTGSYNDSPSIPLYLGRAPWGNPLAGKVADFRIWNIARTAAEIAANYKSKVAPATSGLYINYDFGEQTSDHTANLVSGNNTGWLMETATTNYTWGYLARVDGVHNASEYTFKSSSDVNVVNGGTLILDANTVAKSINIQSGGKLTLSSGNTLTATYGITLQSDATGTATFVDTNNSSPQAVSGTVQQYLTAARNWYTASPVTTGTAAVLNLGTSVQTYSESAKGWSILNSGDALVAGKGYVSVATTGTGSTGTVSFNGTLNTGTIAVPVTRTESGSSRGFNLVANPYPSYLDWSLVKADGANANIGSTIWFRTKNTLGAYTFATHNGTSGETVTGTANTTITKFIPPLQAFWILVNANVGQTTYSTNITFKNSMRAHGDDNGNKLKTPKQDDRKRIRLQVSNGTTADETLLYFDANAQNVYDAYDSPKMFNNTTSISEIYTQVGTEKLVINGMNELKYDTEIPIGFSTAQANDFSVSANELSNFEAGTKVILIDKQNPTVETELTNGIVYNFSSPITATTDRFSILFRAPGVTTEVNATEKLNAQVFVNAANQITIISPEKCNYAIYNAVGMMIEDGKITAKLQTVNYKLQTGFYVVKVNNQSARVIVK